MKSKSILLQSNLFRVIACGLLFISIGLFSLASQAKNKFIIDSDNNPVTADSTFTLKGIKLSGSDSSHFDRQNHLITLYGGAALMYGDISIKGDQITVDEISMKAYVKSSLDAQGHKTAHAFFQERNQPALVANSLVFDLKNKKILTSQR